MTVIWNAGDTELAKRLAEFGEEVAQALMGQATRNLPNMEQWSTPASHR